MWVFREAGREIFVNLRLTHGERVDGWDRLYNSTVRSILHYYYYPPRTNLLSSLSKIAINLCNDYYDSEKFLSILINPHLDYTNFKGWAVSRITKAVQAKFIISRWAWSRKFESFLCGKVGISHRFPFLSGFPFLRFWSIRFFEKNQKYQVLDIRFFVKTIMYQVFFMLYEPQN